MNRKSCAGKFGSSPFVLSFASLGVPGFLYRGWKHRPLVVGRRAKLWGVSSEALKSWGVRTQTKGAVESWEGSRWRPLESSLSMWCINESTNEERPQMSLCRDTQGILFCVTLQRSNTHLYTTYIRLSCKFVFTSPLPSAFWIRIW